MRFFFKLYKKNNKKISRFSSDRETREINPTRTLSVLQYTTRAETTTRYTFTLPTAGVSARRQEFSNLRTIFHFKKH